MSLSMARNQLQQAEQDMDRAIAAADAAVASVKAVREKLGRIFAMGVQIQGVKESHSRAMAIHTEIEGLPRAMSALRQMIRDAK
jgi:hypothetical protein